MLKKIIRELFPVALAALAYFVLANHFFHYVCPSMIVLGLPCPGCGVTRAGLLLLGGRFQESLAMNPMLAAVLLAAPFYLWLWRRRVTGRLAKTAAVKWSNRLTILLISISILVFLYRMKLYFPYREPFVINPGAPVFQLLGWLRAFLRGS